MVYASITGVSVGDMFMGGWIPGIMMGLSLVIIIMIECRKKASSIQGKVLLGPALEVLP